jgi:hypothetical protein
LSEILKAFWAKLYAWAFPSALALGAYCLFVSPKAMPEWLHSATDTEKAAIFIAVTAAIAVIMNAFSTPLYRVLEGYLLWPRFCQQLGTRHQLMRKKNLESAITRTGWKRGLELEKLALYPKRNDQVVPTRFGNAIRSFETYGKTRFNLDTQTVWYELYAVAPKYLQLEYKDARSSVDFFVALIYLSACLGGIAILIAVLDRLDLSLLIVSFCSFLTAVACHWLAVRATGEWGYTVQALVNVGRVKLAEGMGLELPTSLEEEKVMWGLVTKYTFFADASVGRELDRFRKKARLLQADSCGEDEPAETKLDEDAG